MDGKINPIITSLSEALYRSNKFIMNFSKLKCTKITQRKRSRVFCLEISKQINLFINIEVD